MTKLLQEIELPPIPKGMPPHLKALHEEARAIYMSDPSVKCYQRVVRELHEKADNRVKLTSLGDAVVQPVSNEEAKTIIEKYEWLGTIGPGIVQCYGLKLNNELLGVVCFAKVAKGRFTKDKKGQTRRMRVGHICDGRTPEETEEIANKTAYLARGACVPWAPKNAGSFLIRYACRLAHKERGWSVFFAYSDLAAGEIGTIYQASNWYFLGTGLGQKNRAHYHSDYVSPHGEYLSSHKINHSREKLMGRMGAPQHVKNGKYPFRAWLRDQGWKQKKQYSASKGVYAWFEGPNKEELKTLCRYPLNQKYPKRQPGWNMMKLEVGPKIAP